MLTVSGYFLGRRRAVAVAVARGRSQQILHSRPTYYGALAALWCAFP
ncbi:MAG: phosphate ABC transporter permease family protein, partial [Desulfobacteraceae bacterium]|nr:phosphate ABC transporter permease family protein [Desulfobacteraceae bacterium]